MMTFGWRHTLTSQNSSRRKRSRGDSKCGSNGSSLCNTVLSYRLPLPRPAPLASVYFQPLLHLRLSLCHMTTRTLSAFTAGQSDVSRTPCPRKANRKKESWGHARDRVKGSGPSQATHTCPTTRATASPVRGELPPTNHMTDMLHN